MTPKLNAIAILSLLVAVPALAAEPAQKIDPAKGPTSTMDSQVPQMTPTDKSGAATNTTAPSAATDKMQGSANATNGTGITLSQAEAKTWIGKPVYSSDGKKIGEVESFRWTSDGKLAELNAGIGGFLGLGETKVSLLPAQFKLDTDRVVTTVLAADAKNLPKASM